MGPASPGHRVDPAGLSTQRPGHVVYLTQNPLPGTLRPSPSVCSSPVSHLLNGGGLGGSPSCAWSAPPSPGHPAPRPSEGEAPGWGHGGPCWEHSLKQAETRRREAAAGGGVAGGSADGDTGEVQRGMLGRESLSRGTQRGPPISLKLCGGSRQLGAPVKAGPAQLLREKPVLAKPKRSGRFPHQATSHGPWALLWLLGVVSGHRQEKRRKDPALSGGARKPVSSHVPAPQGPDPTPACHQGGPGPQWLAIAVREACVALAPEGPACLSGSAEGSPAPGTGTALQASLSHSWDAGQDPSQTPAVDTHFLPRGRVGLPPRDSPREPCYRGRLRLQL